MTNTTLQILLDRFNDEYEKLYESERPEDPADVAYFDALAAIDPETVSQFARFRHDFISSGREAAAFAIAFRACKTAALGY